LSGAAVFLHDDGPACLAYCVEVDSGWATRRGTIRGFVGHRAVDHDIRHDEEVWRLDGVAVEGLGRLLDLDLSFTPATNVLQLRRAAPPLGLTVDLPAAWFNLDDATLAELPQRYERLSEISCRYQAPSVLYEDVPKSARAVSSNPIQACGRWRHETPKPVLTSAPSVARRETRAAGSACRPIARWWARRAASLSASLAQRSAFAARTPRARHARRICLSSASALGARARPRRRD